MSLKRVYVEPNDSYVVLLKITDFLPCLNRLNLYCCNYSVRGKVIKNISILEQEELVRVFGLGATQNKELQDYVSKRCRKECTRKFAMNLSFNDVKYGKIHACYTKGPVTRCNFPGNLQRNSTLKRCK